MKIFTFLLFILFAVSVNKVSAQELTTEKIIAILQKDDAIQLATLINNDNINNCYTEKGYPYSALSQTVRYNAKKCFDFLIAQGADVNKVCNGYVPPLMHAAKYGHLDMVKILVAKGANVHYQYDGDNPNIQDMTPLTYAEKFNQKEVADYLRSLK